MAKKSKRQSRRSTSAHTSTGRSAPLSRDFDPDYTHVVTDLKRIGILAGGFFVILVILSFIL